MSLWSLPMLNRTPLQSASTLLNVRWMSLRNRLPFGRCYSSSASSPDAFNVLMTLPNAGGCVLADCSKASFWVGECAALTGTDEGRRV